MHACLMKMVCFLGYASSHTGSVGQLQCCSSFIFVQISVIMCVSAQSAAHHSAAASCLFAVEIFSIDTRKERCPLCYVHFSASSRALQPWTQCGDGGWLGRGAGVRGAFFFNLPCSILTKLIFFQIKHFFAQQITNTIQIKSRLRPHFQWLS